MTATEEGTVRAGWAPEELAPVLIWHPHAEAYRKILMQRLPGVPLETHSGPGQLPRASTADVLLTWKVPAGGLARLPALRWIHATGAGVDHLVGRSDLLPTVRLSRSDGRFGTQVAEYVVGYLLHGLLKIEQYRRDQDRGAWTTRPRPLLADCRIGVIGLGHIGGTIAERLASFGPRVMGVCHSARPVPHVDRVFALSDWRAMLPLCDALILATPLTDQTRGMIDEEALRALPAGATLVSVGRGEVLDEQALLATLRDGHIGTAVLDVFAQEPLPPNSPLWTEPNAWITPHVAGPSELEPIAAEFAANYRRFISGDPLVNQVDLTRSY